MALTILAPISVLDFCFVRINVMRFESPSRRTVKYLLHCFVCGNDPAVAADSFRNSSVYTVGEA